MKVLLRWRKKTKKLRRLKLWKNGKEAQDWLQLGEDMKMFCKVCISQKSKLELMQSFNSTSINGSTNYKPSTLKDHSQTECHKRAVKEEEEMKATAAGTSVPKRKIIMSVPEDSAIRKSVKKWLKMSVKHLLNYFTLLIISVLKDIHWF